MVAVAPNGDWVGLSELYREDPGRPDTLRIGLTGVHRDWRGHHLGLALKLTASRSALARGYRYAKTGNHSSNRPMLAINEAMGFVRGAARITLNKSADGANKPETQGVTRFPALTQDQGRLNPS